MPEGEFCSNESDSHSSWCVRVDKCTLKFTSAKSSGVTEVISSMSKIGISSSVSEIEFDATLLDV